MIIYYWFGVKPLRFYFVNAALNLCYADGWVDVS